MHCTPPGKCDEANDPMIIKSANYVTSALDVASCPESDQPEFAIIGRSNVGKSSLLNLLVGRKALARVSGTPGRTQMINFFSINDRWTLVDLPGYGYAEAAKKIRQTFQPMICGYMTRRPNLVRVFVLIDSRHPPQTIDLEFVEWLMSSSVPMALVFTKADKVTPTKVQTNIGLFQQRMSEWCSEMPRVFITSATKGTGRAELLSFIGSALPER
jgi:GTP-binding protein